MISEYKRLLKEAGIEAVVVADNGTDLNVYAQASSAGCRSPSPAASCCAPAPGATAETNGAGSTVHNGLEQVLHQVDVNAYAASFRVYAAKWCRQCDATARQTTRFGRSTFFFHDFSGENDYYEDNPDLRPPHVLFNRNLRSERRSRFAALRC